MVERRIKLIIRLTLIIVFCAGAPAFPKTWLLKQDQDRKMLELSKTDDSYLLAITQIKKLINTGQCEETARAFDKLKKDFPQTAGPDLDALIKAELLFCNGKFAKAGIAYRKFLSKYPQSPFYQVVLERQFAIATAFLAGQKKRVLKFFKIKGYAEGEKMMDNIIERAGDDLISLKAAIAVAKSLEERGKFLDAYSKWDEAYNIWEEIYPELSNFLTPWQFELGVETMLAKGRCQHALYPGPQYSSVHLITANSSYEKFRNKYPKEAKKFKIEKKLNQIVEQEAYKEFMTGEYYRKTNNILAANLYYQMIILEKPQWSNTVAAKWSKSAMENMNKSSEKEKSWKTRTLKKLEKLFL